MIVRAAAVAVAVVLGACGGAAPEATQVRHSASEVAGLLLEFAAAEVPALRRPEDDRATLEAAARTARGADRVPALARLAVLALHEAEAAGARRERRRAFRKATRAAERLLAATRDPAATAFGRFLLLWCAWRDGSPGQSARLADGFVRRHRASGHLLPMAWILRGEISLEARRPADAARAFRYVLGSPEHPLYGLALLRTAAVRDAEGESEEARELLVAARDLGCGGASPFARHVGVLAARALGSAIEAGPEGPRPVECARRGAPPDRGVTEAPPAFEARTTSESD